MSEFSTKSVCIIGTSNALVRGGWFDGFAASWPYTLHRYALGGAPFIQFLGKLNEILSNNYDIFIVDTSPNDESYASQVGSDLFFDSLYTMFLSTLVKYAPTVVLRIPTKKFISSSSPVFERQVEICEAVGCHFIDCTKFILSFAEQKNCSNSLYVDNYHPVANIMHQIGEKVSLYILSNSISNLSTGHNYSPKFRTINIQGDNFSQTSISTSTYNGNFSMINAGLSYNFNKYFFCLGFFVDAGHCNGIIRLHGNGSHRDLSCHFDGNRNKNIAKFVCIPNGFFMKAISVEMPYKSIEFALHSEFGHTPPFYITVSNFLEYSSEDSKYSKNNLIDIDCPVTKFV